MDEKIDIESELEAFEERVRLLTQKGMLLPFPVALFLAGISDTRLRQLVASGKLETAIVDQRPYIVLKSLVDYRRRALKSMAARKSESLSTRQRVKPAIPCKSGPVDKPSTSSNPPHKPGK